MMTKPKRSLIAPNVDSGVPIVDGRVLTSSHRHLEGEHIYRGENTPRGTSAAAARGSVTSDRSDSEYSCIEVQENIPHRNSQASPPSSQNDTQYLSNGCCAYICSPPFSMYKGSMLLLMAVALLALSYTMYHAIFLHYS